MQFQSTIILWCIIMLLTLIHELGHFIIARLCHIHVATFAIGFGPNLLTYEDKAKTKWCWNLVPLGGYVEMASDGNEADAMLSMSPVKRILVALGGPLFNILFFFLGGILFYHYSGFNGNAYIYNDRTYYFANNAQLNNSNAHFVIEKYNNEEKSIIIKGNSQEMYRIYEKGPSASNIYKKLSFYDSYSLCLHKARANIKAIISIFSSWKEIRNLKSIVGVQQQLNASLSKVKTWRAQARETIFLLLMFSLSLGLFNLLPLFGLDGFWVLVSFIGIFFRPKPGTQRRLISILNYGTLVVFGLFFLIIFKDISYILWEYFGN